MIQTVHIQNHFYNYTCTCCRSFPLALVSFWRFVIAHSYTSKNEYINEHINELPADILLSLGLLLEVGDYTYFLHKDRSNTSKNLVQEDIARHTVSVTQEIEELATVPQISSQQINLVCIRLNSELQLAEAAISSHQH